MAGMFDDLPDSKTAPDLFDDIPTAQPTTPAGKGFLRTLMDDIGAAFSGPKSVLEGVKFDKPFDFNEASRAVRPLDDAQARIQQYGSVGPVVGPKATAGTIATGLASDLVTGAKTADAGIDRMISDATGSEYLAGQSAKKRAQAGLTQDITTPEFESDTGRAVYSGLSSLARQVPTIAAAVATRNPNIALGGMVAPMLPDEYGKFRERDASPGQALGAAAATSAIEFLTEKLPMGVIVDKFGKVGAKRFLSDLLIKDMTGEQVATITQDAIDTAVANPDKTWGQYFAERPDAAYQTAVATLAQGGAMGAANRAVRLPDDLRNHSNARALSGAIDADASALFDDIPQAMPEPVNRISAQLAPAIQAPTARAPDIPALGFDPSVKNPQPVMVADAQGNVRPMDSAEQFSQEQEAQRLADLGLTPDVQRAARSESNQQAAPGLDLIQRLMATGWAPPNSGPQQTGMPDEVQADPDLVAMLSQEFEKLYQGDIKGDIKTRLGLAPAASAPVEQVQQFPLRAFLREMGIAPSLAKDITGEGGLRANNRLPGTFRKGGMNLDALVERAVERGFITPQEVESARDNGGANRLVEMIQAELRGERQTSTELADVENEQLMQHNASAELEKRAAAIGFNTKGMTGDQVAAALGRIDRKRAKVQAQKDAAWSAQQEVLAEQQAIVQAKFVDAQIDAALSGQSNTTTEDAMRALGFTEQEIQDATSNRPEGTGQDSQGDRGADGNASGQTPGAIGADPGSPQGQREGQGQASEPAKGLNSYTPDELRQRQERQAQAQSEQKAKDQANDQRSRADAERNDFALVGSDRPADVAASRGQQDIFSESGGDKPASQMSAQDLLRAAADKMDQEKGVNQPPALAEKGQSATENVAKKPPENQPQAGNVDSADAGVARESQPALPHVEFVQLTWPDGFKLVDAQRGLDKADALERAQRGWAKAKVTPITREQAEALSPGIGAEVDDAKQSDAYNAKTPRRNYAHDKQLQLFLDSGPDASQAGQAGEAAQRAAVSAVDDLRSTATLLGLALSGDLSARQGASLVGQKVTGPEDLAILAQVYRDPRFETFRVVFVNDKGGVVSQVGLTDRLPAATTSVIGKDMDAYLLDLMATAKNHGATGYYMLHNHPSGLAESSFADRSLTQMWATRTARAGNMDFHAHVVIDTNQYSVIDQKGRSTLVHKNFGQLAPMTKSEFGGFKITGPGDVMGLAKRMELDKGAVTLVVTDSQFVVKNITTLPNSAFGPDAASNRKMMVRAALAGRGANVFAVGRDMLALERAGQASVDAIHISDEGQVTRLRETGVTQGGSVFPAARRTRVTADTSPEFAYLRQFTESQMQSHRAAAEDGPQAQAKGANYPVNGIQSAAAPWTVPEPGAGDAFIRAIQNNKIDLKRLRDALAEQFGRLPVATDAYLGEELYHGRVSARVMNLHDTKINPLLQKIAVAGKNAGVTVADVNEYLHARHAPERNAAMQAINPGMPGNDALSGMSDQEASTVMQRFASSGKSQALASIAKDIDRLLADTRTDLVVDGLEDAGVVQAWEQAYKFYVPLQREAGSNGTPRGAGFSVRGPEAKRAVGSNKEAVNILANIVTQAETAAIRAEKAIVGRQLLAMARQYPNRDFWTVNEIPTKPRVNKDTGLVERNAIDPMYQTSDNVVMVKDYGVEHFITFNKDSERAMAVAKAMKNLDIAPTNKLIEIAGKGTRFMASLLTQRNPLFWATNFARDIQGAMLNLEGTDAEGLQREAMANLPKAFKGMHAVVRGSGSGQWARYAKEFAEAGGTTGYMQVFGDSDLRMKHLEQEVAKMAQGKADPRRLARNVLDFIDDYNDIIENAVRLTVFQSARDAGVSTPRAASIAKNITVNFNRKGNLTPTVNSLYMFFNANVQGTARLAQAITTSRSAQVAVGGIAMMGFLLDMIGRAMSDDDEETGRNRYDMIPEHEKANNWILMNPMRPGEYVKVPLPLGPHIFSNAGRLVSDAIFRKNPRNASEYGWSVANLLMGAFSPLGTASTMGQLIAPSLVDPILQVAENKSFTGGPVYKSADRGFGKSDPKPAYTRHFESTPELWKSASKTLNDMTGGDRVKPGLVNIEPDILGHIFYTMTGGPGRTLVQAVDTANTSARGESVTVNRVPMVSRFYGTNDDRQRERVFYDERKRATDAKTQFDYFMKSGRQELAREVLTDLGGGDAAAGRKKMRDISNADKQVRKINGEMRRKMEAQDDGQAQAEQLRALRQRRMRVMSSAVDEDE